MYSPFFLCCGRQLHFTDAQLGLVGSIFIWVYAFCFIFSGRLADLIPSNRLILSSVVLWSLTMLGAATSRSVGSFLFWRALIGVAESLYFPAGIALMARLHPSSSRTTALSVHCTAPICGIALGGWFGGWTAEHMGWRPGFCALGIAGVAYVPILYAILRHLPRSGAQVAQVRASPTEIFRSHCYLAQTLAFFLFNILLWVLYNRLPNLVYERYHLSLTESGVAATLYLQCGSLVGVLMGGMVGDRLTKTVRLGHFFLGAAGLFLCSPFAYLVVAVHSLTWFRISAVAFGVFAGLVISEQLSQRI